MALLKQRGYVLATSREQYMALVRLTGLEFDKNASSFVFDKLRVELQTTGSAPRKRAQHTQQIFRLMRPLQERKRLQQLRLAGGTVIRDKLRIASELTTFWSSIMQGGAKTQDEVESYLVSKGIHFRLAQCTPLLFKELSANLVTAALERLKNGPVPGLDGVPACIYQHFPDIFVQQLLYSLHGFMAGDVPLDSWTVALVSSIPKHPGVPLVEGLRPISVCNVLLKWVTIVLLMQIDDILHPVVLMEQKGCLRGRQIMEHVWHATGAWHEMS